MTFPVDTILYLDFITLFTRFLNGRHTSHHVTTRF